LLGSVLVDRDALLTELRTAEPSTIRPSTTGPTR
jgi:hypothetical protein